MTAQATNKSDFVTATAALGLGVLVFITVLSINLVGDGLRDAFDPKLSRS